MTSLRSEYWFSEKLVRGPSRVHGDGLFAKQDILHGEVVITAGGALVSRQLLPAQGESPHSWLSVPGNQNQVLFVTTEQPFQATFLNHSCAPNLNFDFPQWTALRNIKAGEELFTDYTKLGYPPGMLLLSECLCNNPECICRDGLPLIQPRRDDHS